MRPSAQQAAICAGYACVCAVMGCCQTTAFSFLRSMGGPVEAYGGGFTLANMLACGVAMLASALIARTSRNAPRIVAVSYMALTSIGFCMLIVHGTRPPSDAAYGALFYVEAVCLGLGLGCGRLLFLSAVASFDTRSIPRALVLAAIVAALLAFAARLPASWVVSVAMTVAMFAISIALPLFAGRGGLGGLTRPLDDHARWDLRATLRPMMGPLLFVGVISFASGALRAIARTQESLLFTVLLLACSLLGAVAYLAIDLRSKGEATATFERVPVRLALLAAVTAAYFALPFVGEGLWVFLLFVVDGVYMVVSLYAAHYSLTDARVGGAPAMLTAGLLMGFDFLATAAGFAANRFLGVSAGAETQSVFTLALIAVYVMGIGAASVLVGRRRQVDAAAGRTAAPIALSVDEAAIRGDDRLTEMYRLTNREIDVLILTMGGLNADGISAALGLSKNTVRTHQQKLYRKLGVHSKEELRAFVANLAVGAEPPRKR